MSENTEEFIKLDEDRIEYFVNDSTAEFTIKPIMLELQKVPRKKEKLEILDVGGGNGTYIDLLLDNLPDSNGTVVELSTGMIEKNIPRANKSLVCDNFLDWSTRQLTRNTEYDLICFNFVLHHFVGKNYSASLALQNRALENAKKLLSEDGMIVIYEILYNGRKGSDLPGRIIHALTSSKLLENLIKKLGANTAGFGVCFHSEKTWKQLYANNNLKINNDYLIIDGEFKGISEKLKKLILQISSMSYKIQFLKEIR